MSKPAVGRVVHFHASTFCITATGPWPALITKVHSDRCVTVGGFDEWGKPFAMTSCIFVPYGEAAPARGPYAYLPSVAPLAKVNESVSSKPVADTSDQAIEREILEKGLTAARVTPADIEANIKGEYYFTGKDGCAGATSVETLARRLLGWEVPAEVHPDGTPGKPGRYGTNLLTHAQAVGMLEYVLEPAPVPVSLAMMTFCVLELANGFTVVGTSAVASPENFDPAVGRKVARQNAIQQIWPLMGYELRSKLAAAARADAALIASEG